ncbi:WGR domain-containing protein [Sphaerospermopsis kisseleviana CS-549]|uniref:WGR domain-containing protein n=1 Tax=Sphaerospermopsis kisseleviana CS-549 TaxID=3021783 RepID=A0ABT4ZRS7_9CYAN|nr:WGR domain-containing protein [Sphaerospermopsis kisseleviana]MDB9441457.1 WGR domain-containing protein [Sphaerospermopsis kisseleviana CS-549]BAZ83771.1 WGR domain-containing protein [Sphaerospermopsis kisseleviana NIES-73]
MEIYLVFVDAAQNSNKFWSAKVEQGNLTVEWGRVGYKSQQKVHACGNYQKAVSKFNNLVADKKMKGYRESQAQIDNNSDSSEIKRAIQLLEILRPYVAERQFANSNYLETLNQYLKIVPTPLGMKIIPSLIYRHVGDVDHQLSLLNSLLETESVQGENTAESVNNRKVISLKTISKNFWRHI